MKKIKLSFLAAAMLAIGSAFTPQNADDCFGQQLYAFVEGQSDPVPVEGGSTGCLNEQDIACKYYNAGTTQNPIWVECDKDIYGRYPYQP